MGAGGPNVYAWYFIPFVHAAQIAVYYVCPPQNEIASYAYANTCMHVCTLTSAIYINCLVPI